MIANLNKRVLYFLVVVFVLAPLIVTGQDNCKKGPREEQQITEVVQQYIVAKQSYNIEKQLDLLSEQDLEVVDYATLKRTQPGALTQMLFSRYSQARILKIELLPEHLARSRCLVEYESPDCIVIGKKYSSIPSATLIKIYTESRDNLIANGSPKPSEEDIQQKVVEKIYHGKELPLKKSEKWYLLVKSAGGWKIELMKHLWEGPKNRG